MILGLSENRVPLKSVDHNFPFDLELTGIPHFKRTLKDLPNFLLFSESQHWLQAGFHGSLRIFPSTPEFLACLQPKENFKAALDRCAQILEGHPLLEPTGDWAPGRAGGRGS